MTNAELLAKTKAEIERRIELHDSLASNAESEMIANLEIGAAQALDDILSFLSTLESEPFNGLEEEIKRYYDDCDGDCRYVQTARHFAQWGAEHAKLDVTDFCKSIDPSIAQCIADHSWEMLGEDERPVPNGLEEAARKYQESVPVDTTIHYCGADEDVYFANRIVDAVIFGAKWQEKQDEKEQADLFTIVALDAAQRAKEQMMSGAVEGVFQNTPFPTICLDDCKNYDFKEGDTIRVIVLPKED